MNWNGLGRVDELAFHNGSDNRKNTVAKPSIVIWIRNREEGDCCCSARPAGWKSSDHEKQDLLQLNASSQASGDLSGSKNSDFKSHKIFIQFSTLMIVNEHLKNAIVLREKDAD